MTTARTPRAPRAAEGAGRTAARTTRRSIPGWDPRRGRLVIDTPYTQVLAGWAGGEPARFDHLELSTENPFAVLAVSSIGPEPLAGAKRLLVTAVARIEPTGFLRVLPGPELTHRFGLDRPVTTYGRLAYIHCDEQPAIELLEVVAPEPEPV